MATYRFKNSSAIYLNGASTPLLVAAEVSKKVTPNPVANAFPSDVVISDRESIVPSRRSLLLQANTVIGVAPGERADFTPTQISYS